MTNPSSWQDAVNLYFTHCNIYDVRFCCIQSHQDVVLLIIITVWLLTGYPLREIPVGRLCWRYISTVLHLYAERAASILPAEGIYIVS